MKILQSEVLYEGKLRGVRDLVETPDGRRFKHETIHHPGAVVILPVMDDGSVVFVSQYRHSLRKEILELPAGTLEPGELPIVCAARELQEEIGMAAHELLPMGTIYPAPGFCDEVQHLFVGRGLYESALDPDEDEVISCRAMTIAELERAVVKGELCDAKSIALFMRARLAGLL